MVQVSRAVERRAQRALERQLAYQQRKVAAVRGREPAIVARMTEKAQAIRARLEAVAPVGPDVLDVGCGAHGNIFFFGAERGVGVDPLSDHYATLFPTWQDRARTIAAGGEDLPFGDASFDVVLCDNVVDHATSPRRIVEEIARVLRPGGLLYFEVNVHHPFYHLAASAHAGWRTLGVPIEIAPFADHTVHLTRDAARALFAGLPFRFAEEQDDIAAVKRNGGGPARHAGDRLKRLFFKNARYEVIAVREN